MGDDNLKQFWSFEVFDDHVDLDILDEVAGEVSWWGDEVTPKIFAEELSACCGKEVHVRLNSPGGDAFAGAAIYDMIRAYRGKTVAIVSLAASAASLIAMACDEIRISVVGTIMVHEPWCVTVGQASDHLGAAAALETIREGQIDAYAKRTGQSREKILEIMQGPDGKGTYMNARQAVELGFADSIIGEDESGQMRARLDQMKVASCIERASRMMAAAMETASDEPEPEDGGARDPGGEPDANETAIAQARLELTRALALTC